MFNPFKKPNPTDEFWRWFALHARQYEELGNDSQLEAKMESLAQQLRRVDKRLAFEFSAANVSPHEFIISADGQAEVFPVVEALVVAAPPVEGWRIIAFRQRHGTELMISWGDVELGAEQLWFSLEGDGERVGIRLFFRGVTLTDEVAGASFILLDGALGEYDMETKVGFIERLQLQNEDDTTHLKPFAQLPAAFDAFWAMRGN